MTEPPADPWATPVGPRPGQPPSPAEQPTPEEGPSTWAAGLPPPSDWDTQPAYPSQWGATPPAQGTNPWAVVALVTGILPLFVVAIPAGIVALVQNHRRPQGGTGLAIAGLVLGAVWTLFMGFALIGFLLAGSEGGELGRVADAGSTTIGTCLVAPDENRSVGKVVECSQSHDAEIYAVQQLAGTKHWPGYDTVFDDADEACYDAFEPYVGEDYEDSDYDYGHFNPDEAEWRTGERRVVCVVLAGFADELPRSVRGGS